MTQPGGQRDLVAIIAGEVDADDMRVTPHQILDQIERRIGGAIVDQNEFPRAEPLADGGDPAVKLGQVGGFVEAWCDDGQEHAGLLRLRHENSGRLCGGRQSKGF